MNNSILSIRSQSFALLVESPHRWFSCSKTIAALSCILMITGASVTLHAGKPLPPPPSYAYSMRQLSLPSGAESVSGHGLNNLGVVVGNAYFPNNESQACVWASNGAAMVL